MEKKSIEHNARLKVAEIMTDIKINELVNKLYCYDNITFVHCQNVAYITAQICFLLEINEKYAKEIITGALIHDIGKIKVPKVIIDKPGNLTPEEYKIIKIHPTEGLKILNDYDVSSVVKDIVVSHHEKVDGSGYPHGISGSEVSFPSQLVGLVDAYDAMTAKRNYGLVYPSKEAIKNLHDERKEDTSFEILEVLEMCKDK